MIDLNTVEENSKNNLENTNITKEKSNNNQEICTSEKNDQEKENVINDTSRSDFQDLNPIQISKFVKEVTQSIYNLRNNPKKYLQDFIDKVRKNNENDQIDDEHVIKIVRCLKKLKEPIPIYPLKKLEQCAIDKINYIKLYEGVKNLNQIEVEIFPYEKRLHKNGLYPSSYNEINILDPKSPQEVIFNMLLNDIQANILFNSEMGYFGVGGDILPNTKQLCVVIDFIKDSTPNKYMNYPNENNANLLTNLNYQNENSSNLLKYINENDNNNNANEPNDEEKGLILQNVDEKYYVSYGNNNNNITPNNFANLTTNNENNDYNNNLTYLKDGKTYDLSQSAVFNSTKPVTLNETNCKITFNKIIPFNKSIPQYSEKPANLEKSMMALGQKNYTLENTNNINTVPNYSINNVYQTRPNDDKRQLLNTPLYTDNNLNNNCNKTFSENTRSYNQNEYVIVEKKLFDLYFANRGMNYDPSKSEYIRTYNTNI